MIENFVEKHKRNILIIFAVLLVLPIIIYLLFNSTPFPKRFGEPVMAIFFFIIAILMVYIVVGIQAGIGMNEFTPKIFRWACNFFILVPFLFMLLMIVTQVLAYAYKDSTINWGIHVTMGWSIGGYLVKKKWAISKDDSVKS